MNAHSCIMDSHYYPIPPTLRFTKMIMKIIYRLYNFYDIIPHSTMIIFVILFNLSINIRP